MMIAHRFQRLDDHRLGRREAIGSAGHRIGLIRGELSSPSPSKPGTSLFRSAAVNISQRQGRQCGPTPAGYGHIAAVRRARWACNDTIGAGRAAANQ